ncbi:MAG: 2-oxo acid dehydrogenase subunit E2, partial [Candidatus Latescibacterota bacterium]
MAVEFRLPDLGENIDSGDVVNVLVAVGDTIGEDQPVVELETDKAVIEVPSSVRGEIRQIHVKPGDKVAVGQVVLTVEETGAAQPHTAAGPETPVGADAKEPRGQEAPAAGSGPEVPFALPDLGENIESGEVVNVLVAAGQRVEKEQPVLELETDKAVVEVPSSVSGLIRQVHVRAGDRVSPGQVVLTVAAQPDAAQEAAAAAVPQVPAAQAAAASVPPPGRPSPAPSAPVPPEEAAAGAAPQRAATPAPAARTYPAAPSVRRLAREIGVDIAQVQGSGPGGRISEDDVKAHARQRQAQRPPAAPPVAVAAAALPDLSRWGQVERKPMSNVRRATAERMHLSWTTIPQVTNFDRADVTLLERWRKQYGGRVEKAGAKLTPTAIIVKVVAAALRAFPQFNAAVDMANQELVYRKYVHIGVAVDTERGLLVPVIRDADRKNVLQIAGELGELAQRAR